MILTSIRYHVRRTMRHRRAAGETVENHPDPPSPLEKLIGQEKLERYDAALGRLSPRHRESYTNLRAIKDEKQPTGYAIQGVGLPDWKNPPTW